MEVEEHFSQIVDSLKEIAADCEVTTSYWHSCRISIIPADKLLQHLHNGLLVILSLDVDGRVWAYIRSHLVGQMGLPRLTADQAFRIVRIWLESQSVEVSQPAK